MVEITWGTSYIKSGPVEKGDGGYLSVEVLIL